MSACLRALLSHALRPVTANATWTHGNRFAALAEETDASCPFIVRWLNYNGPWQIHYWIVHPGYGDVFLVYMDLYHEDGGHEAALVVCERPDGALDILRAEAYYHDIAPVNDEHYIGPTVICAGPYTMDFIGSLVREGLERLFPYATDIDTTDCDPDRGVDGFDDIIRYFDDTGPRLWERDLVASYTPHVILRHTYDGPDPWARVRLTKASPWARAYDALQRRRVADADRVLYGPAAAVAIQRAWRRRQLRVCAARLRALRRVCRAFGCHGRGVQALVASWL